jgi:FixJ family two-component response regulator
MTAPVIHLIDDDPDILKALSRLLQGSGLHTECHDSVEQFLGRYDPSVPGCVVTDLNLPGLTGLDLQDRLAAHKPAPPVIFLTGAGDIRTSVRAMRAGAADFLTKPVDPADLLAAITRAVGEDAAARDARKSHDTVAERLARLTPRESEVLDLVIAGHLNKQIATKLGTAEKTIKVHRSRVKQKMGARSVAELVTMVLAHRR